MILLPFFPLRNVGGSLEYEKFAEKKREKIMFGTVFFFFFLF